MVCVGPPTCHTSPLFGEVTMIDELTGIVNVELLTSFTNKVTSVTRIRQVVLGVLGTLQLYVVPAVLEMIKFQVVPLSKEYSSFTLFVVPYLVQEIVWVEQPVQLSVPFGLESTTYGYLIVKFTLLTSLVAGMPTSLTLTKQMILGVLGTNQV